MMQRSTQYELCFYMQGFTLWRFDFNNITESEVREAIQCFDSHEKERYDRYRQVKHKNQYAISRYLIKTILSNHLTMPLSHIKFEFTPKGKPYLQFAENDLYFNYSDSESTGLLAISPFPVGVDIEKIKKQSDIFDSINMIMNLNERNWVLAQDSFLRYYIVWTMKEAYLKYLGTGFNTDSLPDLFHLLEKPLQGLYPLEKDANLYIYTEQFEDYVFSLVCSKG